MDKIAIPEEQLEVYELAFSLIQATSKKSPVASLWALTFVVQTLFEIIKDKNENELSEKIIHTFVSNIAEQYIKRDRLIELLSNTKKHH